MTVFRAVAAAALVSGGLAVLSVPATAIPSDRDALRLVVAGCVAAKRTVGLAFPCLDVRLDGTNHPFAVLRAPDQRTEVLVVPTAAIAGIESPSLKPAASATYWQAAWAARRYVADALGFDPGRSAIGIAVNPKTHRTQDQLHLHVDCVAPDVARKLRSGASSITREWQLFPEPLNGTRAMIRSVEGSTMKGIDPIRLLNDGLPMSRSRMSVFSMVVVGTTLPDGKSGFYILAITSGVAERLLDHRCKLG